jgi:ribosomal protein S18 acetylase RimI-like enzyme
MALTSRPYGDADLTRVTDLLHARLSAGRPYSLSVAEIRQVLPRPVTGTARNGRVWEDAGTVVAFALVWPPSFSVQLLAHPDHDLDAGSESGLLDEMVDWCIARGQEIARERQGPVTLHARPFDHDASFVALLERHGFALEGWYTPKYMRSLAGPIPEPSLPKGFSIRHVRGEEEAEAYVALHREAFGTEHKQVADRLALMRDPEYVPELDLVAVAPEGTLAAFVVGGIDQEGSRHAGHLIGYTDPLGTRPAFRRMGLARALLHEAFRRLQQRGVPVTHVSTGSWNTATRSLVESVGYALDHKLLAYAKTIS